MTRAFIVLNRNDLPDNLLQVLDLKPNSSQFSPAYNGQNSGQTGYATWWARDASVNTTVATDGAFLLNGVAYGLAAYLIDNVEDQAAGAALTAAQANAARTSILGKAAAGTALTAAEIADSLSNNGVADADAATTLTAGNSDGTVAEVLRILAGEVYRLPDNSVVEAAGAFNAVRSGDFITRPNVENPASEQGTYGAVRGRKSTSPLPYIRPGEVRAGQTPVQAGLEDVLFRDVRVIVNTGDLHLSALSGVLAELKSATYTFVNSGFTYGGGGTAVDLSGTAVPAHGIARAVTIYDVAGNVI